MMTSMLAKTPSSLEGLIDAVIALAPDCVRERALLQSIDWSRVKSEKVTDMLARLEADGVRVPHWLVKALLAAGHTLPVAEHGALDAPLHAINVLNRVIQAGQAGSHDDIDASVEDLIVREDLDPDLLAAGLRQLTALKKGLLAARLALAHWRRAPQTLRFVQSDVAQFIGSLPLVQLHVASFSNAHSLAVDLPHAFAAAGFQAVVTQAEYGQALAELMRPGEMEPDALVLLLDLDGVHPPDWRREGGKSHELLVEKIDLLGSAIERYAGSGRGPVLVNTLPSALAPTVGLIDNHHPDGRSHAINLVNRRLAEIVRGNSGVILVDANRALANLEPRRWMDPKLWYYGRLPYSADATRALASAFAGAYRTLKRGTAKVLALDMDNTLWGGIFGEDGVGKLVCDDEFPGNAFRAFQHECVRLKSQGMLLTVLSKNNPDAISAFKDHPGMLLKEDDFVAARINWEPKPHNLRSMAEELNLGLDSFVFLDDSPHERAAMRRMCPEVIVPEMPDDPAARPQWLRALAATWPVRLTEEDLRRSDMYIAERQRNVMRARAVSFEDYLRDLDQTLVIQKVDPPSVARAAQMHLRTNQFNLTTERYDDAAITAMMNDERCVVVLGRALDKFGDHGLVICATARLDGGEAVIKSFLMSCRVIGRCVEQTFLGELLRYLAARGARRVTGAYIPTKKNSLVKDFYQGAGFTRVASEGQTEIWGWDMTDGRSLPGSNLITIRWDA
jgi:FkbH-like protein